MMVLIWLCILYKKELYNSVTITFVNKNTADEKMSFASKSVNSYFSRNGWNRAIRNRVMIV